MRRTEVLQGLRGMKFEDVYGRWQQRRLSQAEAAEILGVSERSFRRWRDRYEGEGVAGLLDLDGLARPRPGGRRRTRCRPC
jgi:Helix-turn-helix domain